MIRKGWVLGLVASGALALSPPALAAESEVVDTVQEIQAAIAAEPGAPPAIDDAALDVPEEGGDALSLGGGATLGLPATGDGQTVGNTTVFDATGTDQAQIAVQDVGIGTRALVNIDSADAPERYEFDLSGDVASLRVNLDGSVAAFDADGALVGGFTAPWARDADGKDVPTRYDVEGTTLVQYVYHREAGVKYGVTADPVWLGLAIRACMKVQCWKWMPNFTRTEFLHGHMTASVRAFLFGWFCRKTFIC